MKKLVIGTVIALAATQAAGCIITAEEDYATVGATWEIRDQVDLLPDGTVTSIASSCPPGFNTVALFNVVVDANFAPVTNCNNPNQDNSSTCFVDLYNCEDRAGISDPLPPAMYQTWIAVTDDSGANTYATSLSAYLDVRDINLDFGATIFKDGGFFIVDWDLKAQSNNAPLTCAQAGAPFVTADVTVSSSTQYAQTNPWPCDDHYGASPALPVGSYTVSVQALDSAQGYLGKAPEYTNKLISGENGITDLGTALITIEGM